MYCGNCGAELPEGSRFCGNCGAPVDGSANPTQKGDGHPKGGPKKRTYVLVGAAALLVVVALLAVRLCSPRGIVLASAFPDESLRNQIAAAADTDGDGKLSASEIAALKSLHVKGAKRVTNLGLLTSLEELIVEGEELEYVELHDMPALKSVKAVNAPNLEEVDVVNCPETKNTDFEDAKNLHRITFGDPNDEVEIIVPDDTEVVGDVPAPLAKRSLVADYLFTDYNWRSDGGVGTLNRHWSAAYDDEGKIVSLAFENWMDGAPADLPADYQAAWTYGDGGQLATIAVTSEAAPLQGTWEATTSDSGEWSLLYAPDDASAVPPATGLYGPEPAPLFRVDTLDEQGLVATSTYRAMSARSQALTKGALEATYDADGKLVLVKNGYFGGAAQSLDLYAAEWTYELTYDQLGRITDVVASYPEYVQSYAYAYDSEGRLLSAAGSIDGGILNLIEYSYDEQGHLASAVVSGPSRVGETITFTTDEDGQVTDAVIQRADGTNAEYHVEYTAIYVGRDARTSSPLDVCLAAPSDPVVANVPWAMELVPFTEKDFFRMNQAWLAGQRVATDADEGGEKPAQEEEPTQGASYSIDEATSIYQPIIDDYRANGPVYPEMPDRGYAIFDVDSNGVPELLLGSIYGGILQLWTIDDAGTAVMLVDTVPRGSYTALADGHLFCHGSSGAADGVDTVHRFEGAQLVEVIRFEYHGDDCTYSNADEGISEQESNWDFWSGMRDQFVERDDIEWLPL